MPKRFFSLCILICAALLLIPSAFATLPDNGGTTAPEMQVADVAFSNQGCSFQLRLSIAEMKGTVFVAVYDAQSGQMKRIEEYAARESLSVTLDHVPEADRVKVMWTDEGYMPLAQAEISGNSAVDEFTYDTYEDYTNAVFNMIRENASEQVGNVFPRLLVRSENALPDLSGCNVLQRVSDKEGHTVLQFASPEDAKKCEERLRQYIPSDTTENYVVQDAVMSLPTEPTSAMSDGADDVEASSMSWGVAAIRADMYAADLLKRGLNRQVTVAVVDTGVDYTHEFLEGRTVPGHDYVDNDNDPMDEHYHGTHVAGTVVDCTPGLTNLKIMPVRVLDRNGSGSYSGVSFGIRYAADHGADVINMSLGGGAGYCSVIDEAVEYALSKNVIVVVAAGNDSDDAEDFCPAHIRGCITVSAVDSGLNPAYFTNYGDPVDVAAPGVDIRSCIPDNQYRSLDGTSMATPHVAACAAMLRDEFSNLTPREAEQKLTDTAKEPSGGWDTRYGDGVANMEPFANPEPAEFYAILYSDGEMVFQNSSTPDSGRTTLDSPYPIAALGAQYAGWYALRDRITKVTFAEEVHPASTALWFYGCENLTAIQNPQNLKTGGVTNMSQMFARCAKLETLDLKDFDTGNVTNMRQMFFHCDALRTILASDSFSVAKVTDGRDMFTGCVSLRGGNGTTYSDSHTDPTYARIDGGASNPGYFSVKTEPLSAIYAVLYSDGELQFQGNPTPESGRSVIRSYAVDAGGYNDDDPERYTAWYQERERIRSVNFSIPIYPTSTALWFYGCENLSSIRNINNLHTDNVTDMSQMFSYCSSLTSLDLSGFNTGKTVNTATMFYGCGNLRTIYASSLFRTAQIQDSASMFEGCRSLKGGAGTSYSNAHIDKTYARIDSGSEAGYFTAK